MNGAERTITPEAVAVTVDIAGLGSRMIALLIDVLIQAVVLIPVAIGLGSGGLVDAATIVVLSVILFLVVWAYFPLFEWFWRGRTPGKRAQRLRVVGIDGHPAGGAAILVRNLIRIVDVIAFPFLAVISMLVTRRSQRLGDLAAGTMVVRDRRAAVPPVQPISDRTDLPAIDSTGISEREYDVVRSFLLRRGSLEPRARTALAATLAATVRERIGTVPSQLDDETLLEAAARSYRQRFVGGAGATS